MPLFKGVPNKTIKAIVPLFRLEEHAANAKIFDYGAPGDKMYILIQGVTPACKCSPRRHCLFPTGTSSSKGRSH